MPLSDVVRVAISRETTAPSRTGFGLSLISSFHTVFTERARIYSSVDSMVSDGFAATDPAVRMATKIFGQNPRPTSAIVGREENTQKQKIKLTPVATNLKASYDYIVYINGLEAKFTTDPTPTVADITAGLKAAIDLLSQPVTTTDNTTDLDIEANVAGVAFRLEVLERQILNQKNTTPDGSPNGIVADLIAMRDSSNGGNDDWYTVHYCHNSEDVVKAGAAYIETLVRGAITSSADDEILDPAVTTDLASDLQAAGYVRTMLMYHPLAGIEYPGAAWAGKCLPDDPGSITWNLKTLAGITYTELSDTEKATLKAKDCNYYTRIAGINVTQTGITPGHEWFDVIRGLDWTQVRMQENIFGRLAASKKVPFTDRGIGVVENEVKGVLKEGVTREIFTDDPAPTTEVPLAKNVSTANKAARILPDVKFRATLAGAIHEAEVEGTVSV